MSSLFRGAWGLGSPTVTVRFGAREVATVMPGPRIRLPAVTAVLALMVGAPALQVVAVRTAVADTLGLPPCTPFARQWKLATAPPAARSVLAVRDARAWRRLWRSMRRAAPALDFSRQMVVGVVARPRAKLVIYRVQVDNPKKPGRLEVRVAEKSAFCKMKVGPPGARLHLAAVPRSALPVWFVRDRMIDGGLFGVHNEGTSEHELGRLPGAARPRGARPVVLREDAERRAFATLSAKEVAKLKLGPLGRPMRRVLHPWVRLQVKRGNTSWQIRYGSIGLKVDVATGKVARLAKR